MRFISHTPVSSQNRGKETGTFCSKMLQLNRHQKTENNINHKRRIQHRNTTRLNEFSIYIQHRPSYNYFQLISV